ncbi:DUF805 domain-containing protein [Paludibacterium yongneupense]|uniref:DUF805 domain-containing protein n=1 Tax=Paludibacterium yongneupense TaxID=400061 RepID=UPI00040F04BB|nr:DUF805 domain-containing protein [Paludibacterium yongneupense]
MTFWQSICYCMTHYADFNGRARRSEYGWFVLFIVLGCLASSVLGAQVKALFALAILLPGLAAGARRLHDGGRSGWWQLLALIPVLGALVLIVLLALPGDSGHNRFGPAPFAPPR